VTGTNHDWTPEADAAIKLCRTWADAVTAEIPSDVYLFGSAIYRDGDQFDAQLSDLDLVVLFKEDLVATKRVERLARLLKHKERLELQLIPTLQRTNCVEPGVSLLPISELELQANVHKSGARSFFERNIFLDLKTKQQSLGLPNAGVVALPDDNRQALEFSQKLRNQFLAVSANGTGGISSFSGPDPLPKSLARVAAQLVPNVEVGEWYDTRLGLDFLYGELTRRRDESSGLQALHRAMSVRRGGKGRRRPLTGKDQLLLIEILSDLASAVQLEPMITWEIRFNGVSLRDSERERILDGLRRLVPDGRILKVSSGSIIVRLRSSEQSLETVRKLNALEVLHKFFSVEAVELSPPGFVRDFVAFDGSGTFDRIADHIAEWRPRAADGQHTEAELAAWLQLWLRRSASSLGDVAILREMPIGLEPGAPRPDFLLRFAVGQGGDRSLAIEVTRLRNRSSFFRRLDYVFRFGLPTILVVVGSPDLLGSLQTDIQRLEHISGQVRVVLVPVHDG